MKRIVLIDGSSLAFRAFFSILDLNRFKNKSGLHTNALFSFHRMINQVLKQFEPTHVLVAFDKSDVTFRTEKYQEYKGGRHKTPSEFKEQMPYFSVLLDGLGLKHYRIRGYEADDVIGTLAYQASPEDEVIVISGDKDLTQLAKDNTTVYITRKGVSDLQAYTVESIKEDMGITPEQIIDLKGLMGDSSDNYPGITRVGEKTGLKLLHQFGSIEAMYERLDELKPSKMKENIINDKEKAFMSKDLARILVDAPIDISLKDIQVQERNISALMEFYRQMEFNTFLNDLVNSDDVEDEAFSQDNPYEDFDVEIVTEITDQHLPASTTLHFEILEDNYHFADIIGIAWLHLENKKIYVSQDSTIFDQEIFKQWLEDATVKKHVFDLKKSVILASLRGIQIKGIDFDSLIAAYLIDTNQAQTIVDVLAMSGQENWLSQDELIYGKGAKLAIPDQVELANHLADKVLAIHHSKSFLLEKLEETEMLELYHTIEFPLAWVLARMEERGIKVDAQILHEKNERLLARLSEMEEEIYDLAGMSFNVKSPKQLGEVLFEHLDLPIIKKTKTGYSTAADVLEKLIDKHPIVEKILDYRQISKLQSTYLASLPQYIKEDEKIHTRYVQTLTQTGRLSSTDPNLQNIPIRIEEGKQVRQAFVPSQEDWQFFGADYSQIELRVLAHISEDQHMQEAFIQDEDIHNATARRVFNIDENQSVDSNMRRNAKAVNFGIVYGISDYGLSHNLNITRKKAKEYIDTYFEKFPGIQTYMTSIVDEAKAKGYVSTLFNRRRYLPDIHASNFNIRSFAERTAMNSPIQGTAADIIKIAMIQLDKELKERQLASRMLLQVHDELILEGPESEMEILSDLVPQIMNNAVSLSVPMKVEFDQGNTWYDI